MYDLDSVKRKIKKEGVENFIIEILNERFPENVKNELEYYHIITAGYPNLSVIYSLS